MLAVKDAPEGAWAKPGVPEAALTEADALAPAEGAEARPPCMPVLVLLGPGDVGLEGCITLA